ncbi:hypothetical protein JTB14_014223 [Gonioctena quinquepunctata]|nr:hypothetical protein JTB14_014223 [Gonioctena quinquepunctata]
MSYRHYSRLDTNFELEKFRKFFENGIRKEYYQNYRLLLGENMDWEDFKRIIDKLEDISKQDVLEISPEQHDNFSEKQQTCNCSCKNNIGLQNPLDLTSTQFQANRDQELPTTPGSVTHKTTPILSQLFYTPQTRIPFAPRQPSINFIKITTQIIPSKAKLLLHSFYTKISKYSPVQPCPKNTTQSYPPRNQNFIPNTRTNEGRPKCQICNRIGHSALTCYKTITQRRRQTIDPVLS